MSEGDAADQRWQRVAGTSRTLVRSRLEIERILHAIAQQRTPLTAWFPAGDHLFLSQLRQLDSQRGRLALAYSGDKAANAAVLAARSVVIDSHHEGLHVEFLGLEPREALLGQEPVICIRLPEMLLLQQRRAHERVRTLPGVPLRCIADTRGVISFEAEIVDLSVAGFGAMVYDGGINLEPGTILRGCKIVHPSGTAVDVDIEVRYSTAVTLEDGTQARHAGCRFLGAPERLEDLMRVFVLPLDGK